MPELRIFRKAPAMILYLKNETDLFSKPVKMLHIAPETIFTHIFQNQSNIEYLSGDLDPTKAMIRIDLQSIDFPEDTFDVIYCSHVLEHVPDDRKAMSELYRILKPGGWAILQVPILSGLKKTLEAPEIDTPELRKKFYGQEDHLRVYGLDYIERLKEGGFEVKVDNYLDTINRNTKIEFALPEHEDIYFCLKSSLTPHVK